MKVALYTRCSTSKQDLESQNLALTNWARQNGYEFQLYQDFAVSGQKDSRAGISRLIDDARQKKFSLVGVVELSRIGRSIGFIHDTIKELNEIGINFVLTNTNTILDYTTLEGRALIGGLALAADIEWLLIQERNKRGRDKIKREGIKTGRKQTKVSNEAIHALKEKGLSLRQIAKELGVSAPTIMRRLHVSQVGGSDTLRNLSTNNSEATKTI